MDYRRKSSIRPESLRTPLSDLLGWEAEQIHIAFESTGYSGHVFRSIVHGRRDEQADLLLKGEYDPNALQFYHDVLAPCRLNSPGMLGELRIEGSRWLAMEYVEHDKPDWADPGRFHRAVEWLLRKDRIAGEQLPRLERLPYLEAFDATAVLPKLEAASRTRDVALPPSLAERLHRVLNVSRGKLRELTDRLREGPQTVTHNDFQMLNILFGTGPHQGDLYVVDWTYPAIGSVALDLATLVQVAPQTLRPQLVSQYLAEASFEPFEEIYAAARVHAGLSILTWMIDAIAEGQSHAVDRRQLQETVTDLGELLRQ